MKSKKLLILSATSFFAFMAISPTKMSHESNERMIEKSVMRAEEKTKKIEPLFPINGESVHILKPSVVKYISDMHEQAKDIKNDYVLHDFYVTGEDGNKIKEYNNDTDIIRIKDYYNPSVNEEKSKLVSLVFSSDGFNDNQEFKVLYSENEDMSNAKEVVTNTNNVSITNLLSNKRYYWKVVSGEVESEVQSFVTDDGFRMITAPRVSNIRDMGGRPVSGGKHIKQGLIFRGGELTEEKYVDTNSDQTHYPTMVEEGKKILQDELKIGLEIDFRGNEEANNIVESPLKDENHPVDYYRIPNLPGYDWFYKRIDEYKDYIKNMMLAFKNAEAKHVYFHCWGGADRTGTAGFLLGGLLGMSYTDLIIDYELTSFSCNYRPHNIDDSSSFYSFPSMIYQLKNMTKPNSEEKYYEEDKTISKILEEILIDYVGLTKEDINSIKDNLLE